MTEYTQDPIPGLEHLVKPEPTKILTEVDTHYTTIQIHHGKSADPNTGFTIKPYCASCHPFGPGLVQDAINNLKQEIEHNSPAEYPNTTWVTTDDLGVVLTALERHRKDHDE